jgi:thioredoxin-like negative regulator of GroEL
VALGVFQGLRLVHVRRITRAAGGNSRTTPTLLYFHSDQCAACPAQGRMVEQVEGKWGERLAIERIDAERQPEIASRYGVFSLPTTILLDTVGQVRQVNYGLTHAAKLEQQLADFA